MTTTAGHSFYIGPIFFFFNQVNDTGSWEPLVVIYINFFGQLKDWVGQVLFVVSCPKGQVEKYVNVETC